ncbi:MAG: fluoride efflux transporter CrcB [Calditrichaeota bacterium]|nr:MAG: fluoride efflux transporter CrcB [Calditrichota bacterium]MBL1205816.1 fluoride efflux transporter CrcB [Calditrichota bacterium]NOG45644.1 fluoride efflux transporter CrcB [Calditrichota bacterium]
MNILIIGLGGFIGAVMRYSISGWVHRFLGAGMPYGTLAVNVLGSFILGFFLLLAEERFTISPAWRNFIAVGMMGALTTFSTFSFETFMLFQENLYGQVILNIGLNVVLTIAAVWAGMSLARVV